MKNRLSPQQYRSGPSGGEPRRAIERVAKDINLKVLGFAHPFERAREISREEARALQAKVDADLQRLELQTAGGREYLSTFRDLAMIACTLGAMALTTSAGGAETKQARKTQPSTPNTQSEKQENKSGVVAIAERKRKEGLGEGQDADDDNGDSLPPNRAEIPSVNLQDRSGPSASAITNEIDGASFPYAAPDRIKREEWAPPPLYRILGNPDLRPQPNAAYQYFTWRNLSASDVHKGIEYGRVVEFYSRQTPHDPGTLAALHYLNQNASSGTEEIRSPEGALIGFRPIVVDFERARSEAQLVREFTNEQFAKWKSSGKGSFADYPDGITIAGEMVNEESLRQSEVFTKHSSPAARRAVLISWLSKAVAVAAEQERRERYLVPMGEATLNGIADPRSTISGSNGIPLETGLHMVDNPEMKSIVAELFGVKPEMLEPKKARAAFHEIEVELSSDEMKSHIETLTSTMKSNAALLSDFSARLKALEGASQLDREEEITKIALELTRHISSEVEKQREADQRRGADDTAQSPDKQRESLERRLYMAPCYGALNLIAAAGPQTPEAATAVAIASTSLDLYMLSQEVGSSVSEGGSVLLAGQVGLVMNLGASIVRIHQQAVAAKHEAKFREMLLNQIYELRKQVDEVHRSLNRQIRNTHATESTKLSQILSSMGENHLTLQRQLSILQGLVEQSMQLERDRFRKLIESHRETDGKIDSLDERLGLAFLEEYHKSEVLALQRLQRTPLTVDDYASAMDIFLNNATIFSRGPICTWHSMHGGAYQESDLVYREMEQVLSVGNSRPHLERGSELARVMLALDYLRVIPKDIAPPCISIDSPKTQEVQERHRSFFSERPNFVVWLRNCEQFLEFASRGTDINGRPADPQYRENYLAYDKDGAKLRALIASGVEIRRAFEESIPRDRTGRNSAHRLAPLMSDYLDKLREVERHLSAGKIQIKEHCIYDPSISIEKLEPKNRSLEALNRGIGYSQQGVLLDAEGNAVEPPMLMAHDQELYQKLIPDYFYIARDLFGGDFEFKYESIEAANKKLNITLSARYVSKEMGSFSIFRFAVQEDDPRYGEGFLFGKNDVAVQGAAHWNRSASMESRLLEKNTANQNEIDERERSNIRSILERAIGDRLQHNYEFHSKEERLDRVAQTDRTERLLAEFEGARLLLDHYLAFIGADIETEALLRELPTRSSCLAHAFKNDMSGHVRDADKTVRTLIEHLSGVDSGDMGSTVISDRSYIPLVDGTIEYLSLSYRTYFPPSSEPRVATETKGVQTSEPDVVAFQRELYLSFVQTLGPRLAGRVFELSMAHGVSGEGEQDRGIEAQLAAGKEVSEKIRYLVMQLGPQSEVKLLSEDEISDLLSDMQHVVPEREFVDFVIRSFRALQEAPLGLSDSVARARIRESLLPAGLHDGSADRQLAFDHKRSRISKCLNSEQEKVIKTQQKLAELSERQTEAETLAGKIETAHLKVNEQLYREMSSAIMHAPRLKARQKIELLEKYSDVQRQYEASADTAGRASRLKKAPQSGSLEERIKSVDENIRSLQQELEAVHAIEVKLRDEYAKLCEETKCSPWQAEYYSQRFGNYGSVWKVDRAEIIDGEHKRLYDAIGHTGRLYARNKNPVLLREIGWMHTRVEILKHFERELQSREGFHSIMEMQMEHILDTRYWLIGEPQRDENRADPGNFKWHGRS